MVQETVLETTALALPQEHLGVFFKPAQVRVLEKLASGEELDENQKRYLRGNVGRKMRAIRALIGSASDGHAPAGGLASLLNGGGEYCITGWAALKRNGFGWYFEPKVTEVLSTLLDGRLRYAGSVIRFRRVRSLGDGSWETDEGSGLRYARNKRILKDARLLGDAELERVWWSMLERYGSMFVERPERFVRAGGKTGVVGGPEDYGV